MGVNHYCILYEDLMHTWVNRDDQVPYDLRFLQLMGIRYVVSTQNPPLSKEKIEGLQLIWSDGKVNLFRVSDALPRYYTVAGAVAAGNDDDTVSALQKDTFNFRETVLVHDNPSLEDRTLQGGGYPVQIREQSPTRVRLSVKRDTPGWLVALQAFYPGWTAKVNGNDQRLFRANVGFCAVALDAGTSDVVIEYLSPTLRISEWVSSLTTLCLGIALVGLRWSARRARPCNQEPLTAGTDLS